MWTNIFRIGELRAISWFQFLPSESDLHSLSERSYNEKSLKAGKKDSANYPVLAAHLQLQNEGFLSTWTNSFVGPWDPSQGVLNPDEKIKLWLFLPGRHSSVNEGAQPAVSRLRVIGTGLWLAPGDSEEIAVALSQALRNTIERSLKGLSYVRFGDVFSRCQHFTSSEKTFRRAQPVVEFVFSVSEEGIYVHAVISAKHIRALCSEDMERALGYCSTNSTRSGIPVIVAPNGMRGTLIGCRPSDFVKQVYLSKAKTNDISAPLHVAQSSVCQLRGQSCYAEVTLGCCSTFNGCESNSTVGQNKNFPEPPIEEPQLISAGSVQRRNGSGDAYPFLERTFIYPPEAVLVPIMHNVFARSSLRRLWLQNFMGISLFEFWASWNFPGSSHLDQRNFLDGLGVEFDALGLQRRCNSSSNSNNSSISNISSTSSGSALEMGHGTNDLEADADSLACNKAGDQYEGDGHKMAKRIRSGITENFGQVPTVAVQGALTELKNSATGGLIGSHLDWDSDTRGIGLDIQAILSEFGDFGDFFEDDILTFGEPPGTAESQAHIFLPSDCGDISNSPCNGVDATDQIFSPVTLPSFDNFAPSQAMLIDDPHIRSVDSAKEVQSSATVPHSSASSFNTFDDMLKSEAMVLFASEYTAVDIPSSELSVSYGKHKYHPSFSKDTTSGSNCYLYSATPPSLCEDISTEKPALSAKVMLNIDGEGYDSLADSRRLYKHVNNVIKDVEKLPQSTDLCSFKGEASSSLSGIISCSSALITKRKSDRPLEMGQFLLSHKSMLATEVECMIFQASMCRIRHTLLSLGNQSLFWSSKVIGNNDISDACPIDTSTVANLLTSKYGVKKKDSMPARLVGDIDGIMLDGPPTANVGVWHSVGPPKGLKPLIGTHNSDNLLPPSHSVLNAEGIDADRLRHLQDLLDALPLLVQQSSSFVDISLDKDDGDSTFCWLGLQEQRRRGFSCGPSMIHAGCGGFLGTCHSVDIAGVELVNPLSSDVQVSCVISLLLSDIKAALISAFGSSDGPLSMIDWCKGRSQSADCGSAGDNLSLQSSGNESKDSSEPISPTHSVGTSFMREGGNRVDDASQRRVNHEVSNVESEQLKSNHYVKPTVSVFPLPSILVGYQDDWLKTSANCIQLWEKAPLEPYASPKPISYYAVCPDIDILTSAAVDFFQQMGLVYEACKLGTHFPQGAGHAEMMAGKYNPSELVLVDCPQKVKNACSNANTVSSIRDYFQALSNGWDVWRFLKSLKNVLKDLKLASSSGINQKDGNMGPTTVVYVVCPFPEAMAVLQTLVESCASIGSNFYSGDRERRSSLYSQVAKSLSCAASVDEASASNVLMLSGFSIPKLVLQIITVESLLRITRPAGELAVLKEIAFTVYNKARRIHRPASSSDLLQMTTPGRSQTSLMHVSSTISGLWKDSLAPRMPGSGELDNSSIRQGSWDNSWQAPRVGGLNFDAGRSIDFFGYDDMQYVFEPLFILCEPGSVDHGSPLSLLGSSGSESLNLKTVMDDTSGIYGQNTSGGSTDPGSGSLVDSPDHDKKAANLHCCYGWTEDWRWLICIWTDSRGELLDSSIFPFGGISSRQDTKVLQALFVQILHHGCQILLCSSDATGAKPRDIIITRIGYFFDLECQEWHKAIYAFGGSEIKKWPLQLRRSMPDGVPSTSSDIGLLQERNLPSSPSPSLYKTSTFMKGGLGQTSSKKQLLGSQVVDGSRSLVQLVQNISLISVAVDHSLQIVLPADASNTGIGLQSSNSSLVSGYLEGFSTVKSLGSSPVSYILIPSPNMHFLPPTPFQLPTCLKSESPPLEHLLHSKGSALPLLTGFVVSKAAHPIRRDPTGSSAESWPSVLAVSLIDHYGGAIGVHDKAVRGSNNLSIGKQGRGFVSSEPVHGRDYEGDARVVLESTASELQALSWMTASPVYSERRTPLPFHCDMLLRVRRLIHYADKEFSRPPDQLQQAEV